MIRHADTDARITDPKRNVAAGVRRLHPKTTRFHEGEFSTLYCEIHDDAVYPGVTAVRMFPIENPDKFISLHYTDEEEKDQEIGIIEDINVFSQQQRELLNHCLNRQYHEKVINRVLNVRFEHGLLFFDVETHTGREGFVMPWRGDHAEEYGQRGKVLLDAQENRYIIPDVDALPSKDQRRFTNYIYW